MTPTPPPPGRPAEDRDTPRRLLAAAREAFLKEEYDRVTIRHVARMAGTNSAMIAYYFGNKEGLYKAMLADVVAPVFAGIEAQVNAHEPASFEELFLLYARTMGPNPEFPLLLVKTLSLHAGPVRDYLMELAPRRFFGLIQKLVREGQRRERIDAGVDPLLTTLSVVGLAILPFILRPALQELLGLSLDGEFLERLARHNGRVMSRGIERAAAPAAGAEE